MGLCSADFKTGGEGGILTAWGNAEPIHYDWFPPAGAQAQPPSAHSEAVQLCSHSAPTNWVRKAKSEFRNNPFGTPPVSHLTRGK